MGIRKSMLLPAVLILHLMAIQHAKAQFFTNSGSLKIGREKCTATSLLNGKVLVAGGVGGQHNSETLADAELFDPIAGTWTATGVMPMGCYSHTATLLFNGKVLVAGGSLGKNAELYDPNTETWTNMGSMNTGRIYHTATLLPNGKVLFAGGADAGPSSELYDPTTGASTNTGPMTDTRSFHTATLLPNGKVLVAGGMVYGKSFSSAELYDPTTGTWTATTLMTTTESRIYE
jgi:hypothetical protein